MCTRSFEDHSIRDKDVVVCIHPGSRQEYIRWNKEGFAAVADEIIRQYNAKVILIGAQRENGLVEEVSSLMKERPIKTVGRRLTELVSLIKRCSLFVGNSTGPMHIAAGLQVPVVAVFGSRHPGDSHQKWGPWGKDHMVVSKDVSCKNCNPSNCTTLECMKAVSVGDILKAIAKQMGTMQVGKGS
ncbi:glycosyltransferase family 9 protein [Planctomycetota bacterium]